MNKVNIIIAFLFCMLHSIAFSQDAVDPKAMTLLNKSTTSFNNSNKSSKIDFSCVVENTQSNKKQNLKGYLLLKGEKFFTVCNLPIPPHGWLYWIPSFPTKSGYPSPFISI